MNRIKWYLNAIPSVLVGSMLLVTPTMAESLSDMDACLLDKVRRSEPDVSLGQIKAECEVIVQAADNTPEPQSEEAVVDGQPQEQGESLIAERMQAEIATRFNPFVLSPHKQNYVLFASYNDSPNYEIYNIPEDDFDNLEIKFQLSFKIPVIEGILGTDADLYAAYTSLSFWQAYNRRISSPFRETVHEPEAFLVIPNDWSLFGWKNSLMQFGLVHQSNGQGGYLSRSWNRIYANFIFEKDNFLLGFRPWYRVPENNDDNPDITDYLGHYELRGIYKHGEQTFGLMARNLLENGGRTTVQLDWSFPLYKRWRGYMQYFNGYGESLVDYNVESHRLGFGVQLTDWL
ncbi:MAG: phospholipase A [Candidatus Thiodiazotropha sp.]